VIPYYPRKSIPVGTGANSGFDMDEATIQELADSREVENEPFVDYNFEGMPQLRLGEVDSEDD
jgi:hypothetical protein